MGSEQFSSKRKKWGQSLYDSEKVGFSVGLDYTDKDFGIALYLDVNWSAKDGFGTHIKLENGNTNLGLSCSERDGFGVSLEM